MQRNTVRMTDAGTFSPAKRKIFTNWRKDGFSLAAGHNGSEILHSTRFVLVASDGRIYGRYDSRSKPAMLRPTKRRQHAPREIVDLNILISIAAFVIHFPFRILPCPF